MFLKFLAKYSFFCFYKALFGKYRDGNEAITVTVKFLEGEVFAKQPPTTMVK